MPRIGFYQDLDFKLNGRVLYGVSVFKCIQQTFLSIPFNPDLARRSPNQSLDSKVRIFFFFSATGVRLLHHDPIFCPLS